MNEDEEACKKRITRTFNVRHSVVSWIEVELLVCTATEKICVPGCSVEVKASDEEIGELASCQGVCRLGHPIAKVDWLGRSGARPAHESVRGLPCVDAEGSELKRSVAEVVLGLFAGIAIRLGATVIDLVADDNGSGRLVKYYSRLGFEKAHTEGAVWAMRSPIAAMAVLAPHVWHRAASMGEARTEGASWAMRSPIAAVAVLAPPSWLEGLMPPSFDALKWFCSFMETSQEAMICAPTPISSLRNAAVVWRRRETAGNMPALRSTSVGTGRQCGGGRRNRPTSAVEKPPALECASPAAGRKCTAGARSRPISAVKASSPPDLASAVDGNANRSIPNLGFTAPSAWQPPAIRDSRPLSAALVKSIVGTESAVGIAGAQAAGGCVRQPSAAGMRKRPISAARVCAAVQTLPKMQSLPCLHSLRATTPLSGQWRWNAEWPVDATVDATVTQSKSSKHLRVDAWLHSGSGEELAYVRGAIPPNKGFLRVLWLGCTHSQPVHPSVRSRPAYFIRRGSTGPEVRVTAVVALLGVLAKLACWLNIGSTEVQPLDLGSGKLISYFSSFGFQDAGKDDGESPKMLADSKGLMNYCLPAAWHAQLPPQKASSDLLPRPTRIRSAVASLRAPEAPRSKAVLDLS